MGEVIAFRIGMLQQRLEPLRSHEAELRHNLKTSTAEDTAVQRLLSIQQEIAIIKDEIRLLRSLRD